MIHLNSNKLIYRPIREIFDFISTPENDFQWQYGTLASGWTSESVKRVGASFRSIGHFQGHRMESTYEITDFEPIRKYGFKSLSGPMQSFTLYTLEMAGGATRIDVSTRANAVNLFQADEGILEKQMKKQLKENLEMLKEILEHGEGHSTRLKSHTPPPPIVY